MNGIGGGGGSKPVLVSKLYNKKRDQPMLNIQSVVPRVSFEYVLCTMYVLCMYYALLCAMYVWVFTMYYKVPYFLCHF